MEHTPGPWNAEGSRVYGAHHLLADVFAGPEHDNSRANARLIAAAPELAAIMNRLVEYVGKHGGPYEYAALNEARALLERIGMRP